MKVIASAEVASKIAYPFMGTLGQISTFVSSFLRTTIPTFVGAMRFTRASIFLETVNGIQEAFRASKRQKGFVKVPIETEPSKVNQEKQDLKRNAQENSSANNKTIKNNPRHSIQGSHHNQGQINTPAPATNTRVN